MITEPLEPDLREMLRGLMTAIHQRSTFMPVEIGKMNDIADRVEKLTRDRNDTDEQAWHRAAVATKQLLAEPSESVKAEWIEAYADLPPMRWTAPNLGLS
jgi:hypothetical protein